MRVCYVQSGPNVGQLESDAHDVGAGKVTLHGGSPIDVTIVEETALLSLAGDVDYVALGNVQVSIVLGGEAPFGPDPEEDISTAAAVADSATAAGAFAGHAVAAG